MASKFEYRTEYEREETQKYEGVYTPEEIELNINLMDECTKDNIDFTRIEELLKQGADPLGGTALFGWDLLNHVYTDAVGDSQYNDSIELPRLTELFLKYGMDVDNPRVPYDDANSINPLWEFTFVANENSIYALKMLLDNGVSADSFGAFWGHSITDFFHIECGDPENDEFWNNECVWTLKMLLLGASYDHILNNDEDVRDFICCDLNNYDTHKFREWDKFEYHFNTSYCDKYPELYGSIVEINEKDTGEVAWKIGVGKSGREALELALNKYKRGRD